MEHFEGYELYEGRKAVLEIADDLIFKYGMNLLRDTRKVQLPDEQTFDFFKKATRKLSKLETERLGNIKFAWVVSDAKDFANIHRWSVSGRIESKINRKAFREFDKARTWLGIPEDYKISYEI